MHQLATVESQKLLIMPTEGIVNYFIQNQESEKTKLTYSSNLRGFFAWINKSYKEVGPFDALDYHEYIKTTRAKSTVNNRIITLNMFFKFAKESGLIPANPFALIKTKKPPETLGKQFLLPKETDVLLTALKNKKEKHYILGLILAATGMRISEVQQLSWCDFLLMPDGSVSIRTDRKGDEEQLLSLRDDVWEAIKAYMNREPNQFDRSHLFSNASGNRASVVTLRTWVKDASRKAKITKKVTPHTLRHSFVTNSLNAGADLRDVQKYVNHKSIKTTQLYMHGKNEKVGDFLSIKVR